ncbi:DeoR family fructose operon transcriptional repressor [Sporomusaceae bacterium BoRhaA]|uniref:DeoR/GlpR family DNA-binding transcription regulator n=1 Tax=Pelorhabdus rhamnosifermentans TaxID=2772457 RepID=UPI001C0606D8|nr:DeoR/GlpR family DNA-binding transcription regulator [Pelorhabdus rhamnosifermentans]MBU2702772.1 DeoR family fructose operon transcriptional repressor [Pelorhabdus rhamnosifermentans]
MFAEERQASILELIKAGQPVKVGILTERFGVSESTIRRDLQELEDAGCLHRTHGGAILGHSEYEPSFQEKATCCLAEKQQIATAAVSLIEQGETILLDSGTTTLEIARQLRGKKVTIATNSMDIAQIFVDDTITEVILLGGSLRKPTRSLVGYLTNQTLKNLHFDKVFLAANNIDLEQGVTTPNMMEAETKRHMLLSGQEVILVVDHTKFGQKSLCHICDLSEISLLLTDCGLETKTVKQYKTIVKIKQAETIPLQKGANHGSNKEK